MKKHIKMAIVVILTMLGMVALAPAASADVCPSCSGGSIYLHYNSDMRIAISNSYTVTGSSIMYLYPGQSSRNYTNFRDVDKFWVAPGCTATSQWGGQYSAPSSSYPNGRWFSMSSDAVALTLNHQCPWLAAPMSLKGQNKASFTLAA